MIFYNRKLNKDVFYKETIDQIRFKIKEILSFKHLTEEFFTMTLEVYYGQETKR